MAPFDKEVRWIQLKEFLIKLYDVDWEVKYTLRSNENGSASKA